MLRRWLAAAALLVVWSLPPGAAGAQVAPNYATTYLHPSDVRDARAVWVNPAGLAVLRDASVYAEAVAADPGARGRLRQVSLGFNARGLSFAYQRDMFGAVRNHAYRLGLAGAAEGLAAGVSVARYGGDARGTGWDVGLTYALRPTVTVAGVLTNIGQPVVRGLEQRFTLVPGATWHPVAPAALSAHARVTPDSVVGFAFGASWRSGGRVPLGILARLDTDGHLRRAAFAFGVSFGAADRVGVVAAAAGDLSRVDAAGVYGVSSREPLRRR